jgi:hypothetical protein
LATPLLSSETKVSDQFRQEKESRSFVDPILIIVLIALVFWVALTYAKPGSDLMDGVEQNRRMLRNIESCSPASQKTSQ